MSQATWVRAQQPAERAETLCCLAIVRGTELVSGQRFLTLNMNV